MGMATRKLRHVLMIAVATLALDVFIGRLVFPFIEQPVRIYNLRHADGSHKVDLAVDKAKTHCGSASCLYRTTGHYVEGATVITGVRVYPDMDKPPPDVVRSIVSPEHPDIAVPVDSYGYFDGAIGIFGLVGMVVLSYLATRLATEQRPASDQNLNETPT